MAPRARALHRTLLEVGVAAAAVPLLLLGASPAWAGGPPGTQPGVPRAGQEQSRVVGTPTLTVDQQRSAALKDAAVARVTTGARSLRLSASADASSTDDPPADLPSHRSIKSITQKAQSRSYWCGPATLSMLVQADGTKISQTTAAKRLRTTSSGTNWYSGGGTYPMEKALERYSDGFDYTAQNLPYTPSAKDQKTFRERLVTDVAVHKQGIAGNAVEVTNGPHLVGHPNRTIYHWVAVRGYDDDGATTRYADSVSGSGISWSAPVPRYNEIDTDTIVTIFGARGYIW